MPDPTVPPTDPRHGITSTEEPEVPITPETEESEQEDDAPKG